MLVAVLTPESLNLVNKLETQPTSLNFYIDTFIRNGSNDTGFPYSRSKTKKSPCSREPCYTPHNSEREIITAPTELTTLRDTDEDSNDDENSSNDESKVVMMISAMVLMILASRSNGVINFSSLSIFL